MVRGTSIGAVIAVIAVIAVMVLAAVVSVAAASGMTVTQAIKAQDKIVRSNPEYKSLKHIKANTVAQAKALIPKLDSLKRSVDHAATAVSSASATSSQKAGQRDWVKGGRLLADGLGGLAAGLNDVVHGKTSAAKSALARAQRNLDAADAIGEKGDRLLGLPTSD
jgi:hypothetical protein